MKQNLIFHNFLWGLIVPVAWGALSLCTSCQRDEADDIVAGYNDSVTWKNTNITTYTLAQQLESRYDSARHLGDTKNAIAAGQRLIDLHKKMLDDLGREQYERYSTLYHLQDKEQRILSLSTANQFNFLAIFLLFSGLVTTAYLTPIVIRSRKSTIAYNKKMSHYITNRVKEDNQNIRHFIKESQLFLNSDASYRDIAQGLGITQKRLLEIMPTNEIRSLICNLRLQHACSLLQECPDKTIQAIGEESGFGSLRTFQYAFKRKYELTPDEYRRKKGTEKLSGKIRQKETVGLALILLFAVCCVGCRNSHPYVQKIRNLDYDSLTYILDRDSAVVEPQIRKAETMGTISHAEAALLEANRIYLSDGDFDKGMQLLENNYHSETVKKNSKLKIHYIIALESIAFLNEEYSTCIYYCNEGINYARKFNNDTLYQYFSFDIGSAMFKTKMRDRGIDLMKRSLMNISRNYHEENIDNLVYQYGVLANCLKEWGRYREALEMRRRQFTTIQELTIQDDIPYQTAFPAAERASIDLSMANIYVCLGNRKEGKKYLARFFRNPASQQSRVRFELNEYYLRTGQYQKMLENIQRIETDRSISHIPDNTLAQWREFCFLAAQKLHNDTLALNSADQLLALQKNMMKTYRTCQYAHWASQYRAFDRDLTQQKLIRQQASTRSVAIILLIVLLIAGSILIVNTHYRRLEQKRGRLLQQFIHETEVYKNKQTELINNNKTEGTHQPVLTTAGTLSHDSILKFLIDSQCYHNSKVTTKELAELMQVSQKSIREILPPSELRDVVNKLRLRDACALLYNQPEYTIRAVSDECGFGSLRTFQYAFKNEYGMSPADYRKSALEES